MNDGGGPVGGGRSVAAAAVEHFDAVAARGVGRPLDDDHDDAQHQDGQAEDGQQQGRRLLDRTPSARLQSQVRHRRQDERQRNGRHHTLSNSIARP